MTWWLDDGDERADIAAEERARVKAKARLYRLDLMSSNDPDYDAEEHERLAREFSDAPGDAP